MSRWPCSTGWPGTTSWPLLVRTGGADPYADPVPPGWEAHPVSLEELVLAYLRAPGAAALPGPVRARDAEGMTR